MKRLVKSETHPCCGLMRPIGVSTGTWRSRRGSNRQTETEMNRTRNRRDPWTFRYIETNCTAAIWRSEFASDAEQSAIGSGSFSISVREPRIPRWSPQIAGSDRV